MTIKLPPLRERREDIPLLCAHFLKEFNQRHDKHVTGIAEPLRKLIAVHEWKGNVRELRNVIESMVVQDRDGLLNLDDIQEGDSLSPLKPPSAPAVGPDDLVGRPLSEIERYYIEKTLDMTDGNREEAASKLGIGERTLYRDMQNWKVQDQIKQALAEAGGDLEKAAQSLGLSLVMFKRKMKKLGLEA